MKVIDIKQCATLLPDGTPDLYCRLFPDLFPFGQGHPTDQRLVKVFMEQCIAHYPRLPSRSFGTNLFFTLIAFDIISRRRALMATSISCSCYSGDNLAISSIFSSDLARNVGYKLQF